MPAYRAVLRTLVVGRNKSESSARGRVQHPIIALSVKTSKCWRGHCFPLLHPPVCAIDRGDDLLAPLTAHGPAVVAQFVLWNRVTYAVAKTDEAV